MFFLLVWSNTAMSSLLLGAIVIVFSYYLINKCTATDKGRSRRAPEPSGSWPIIGHLPLLSGSDGQLPHITLGALADKYGPIFMLRLGVHPTLVVSSMEVAKELFTTNDIAVSSRPEFVAVKIMGYNFAMFGFARYGDYWRQMRKVVMLELLSTRRLELLKHVWESETRAMLKVLYGIWEDGKKDQDQVIVELKQWFGDLTLNIIVRMVAGKRYFGVHANIDDGDESKARRFEKALEDFIHYLGMFVLRDAVPYLGWLDLGGHEKAMRRTASELDSALNDLLQEHKQDRARSANDEAIPNRDFMDVLLSVLEDNHIGGYDPDAIIKATCLGMIAGGFDTSSVTLTWAISLLLNNPHVLEKARAELDACIGRERLVSDSDISKLVYLQAIVKETLRLYPPGRLSAPREFMEACTISGYSIPKGTWLMVNLWKIQTDPRVWPDPMEFKPERFLTSHKDVNVTGKDFELIPFGSGRRVCPGMNFGLQVVQWTLASLLHAFNVSTPTNSPIDMSESFGLTNSKITPLDVVLAPRLSDNLY